MAASIHHARRSQPRRQPSRQQPTAAQTFSEALARAEADFRAATQRAGALRAHERAATVPLSAPAQMDAEDSVDDGERWTDTAAARAIRSAQSAWYLPSIMPLFAHRLAALGEWLRGTRAARQTVREEGALHVRRQHLNARLRLGGEHPAVLPTADDCLWALAEVRARDLPADLRHATAALWHRSSGASSGEAWEAAVATLLAACDLRLVAQSDGSFGMPATHYHVTTASPAQLAQVGYHPPTPPHVPHTRAADDRTPPFLPPLDTTDAVDAVDEVAQMRARFYDPNETQFALPTVPSAASVAPSPLGLMTTLGATWPTSFAAPAPTPAPTPANSDPAQTHQALPVMPGSMPATCTPLPPTPPRFTPGSLPAASLMDASLVDKALAARMAPITHPLADADGDTTDDKEGDTTTC